MMTLEAVALKNSRRPFPDSLRKPKPLTTAEWVEAIKAAIWQHAKTLDPTILLDAFRSYWEDDARFVWDGAKRRRRSEPGLLDLLWVSAAYPEEGGEGDGHPADHPHPALTQTVAKLTIMHLAPEWLPGAGGAWYQRSGSIRGTNGAHKENELHDLDGLAWVEPDANGAQYRALREVLGDIGWWGAEWVGGGMWGTTYQGWLLPTEWAEELRRVECVREAQMLAWRQWKEPCLCDERCRCRPEVRSCECDVTTCDCDCRHDL